MRKVSIMLVTIGLIFLFLNSCLANDSTMVRKGKWGISLSVSGLSNLGIGLYQGGLGIKHWFSEGFALKSILGLSARSRTYHSIDTLYSDNKTNQATFAANLGGEFHFSKGSKFSPYFYTGLNYTAMTTTDYSATPVTKPPGWTTKRHTSTSSYGLDGAIGVEYTFFEHLSLAGEYQVGLSFQTDKIQNTVIPGPGVVQPPEMKTTTTTLGTRTSSLILTGYF